MFGIKNKFLLVILWLLFWPILLPYFIFDKWIFKNNKKKSLIGTAIVVVILLIFGALSPNNDSSDSSSTSSSSSASSSKAAKSTSKSAGNLKTAGNASSQSAKSSSSSANKSTTAGLKKYLSKKGNEEIKSVEMNNNILVVETSGVTFNGKILGAGSVDNLADLLGYANSSSLSANGIVLAQKDKYTDSKGNEDTEPSYIIYYSKDNLNSINFKNYGNVVANQKKLLIDNATGYYINSAFNSGKDWQFGDDSFAHGDDVVSNVYTLLDK